MRAHLFAFFVALPAVPSIGCDVSEPQTETIDAERVEVPPQPLPLENTPTAYGMLRVANELGFSALDADVGLDRRAAQSIMAFRAGEDGYASSPDDRYVDSLAQLDELHWMGESNLWVLQRYALQEGFVPDELPEASCAPALVETIDQCLRFTEQAAGGDVTMEDRVPSCLVKSEPACPSSEFFAHSGVTGHEDPMLGYHALLCDSEDASPLCTLGVAGIAAHHGPHCDALFDVE